MKLSDLFAAAGVAALGAVPEVDVHGVAADSRAVTPGDVFVAVDGLRVRGQDFVPAALAAGAAAVVCDAAARDALAGLSVPVLAVADPRAALGPLVSASLGHPSHALRVLAVTGTNGKTTSAVLTAQLLNTAGVRAAALGTLGLWTPEGVEPGGLTTPDAATLQRRLAALRDRGFTAVVLEASSHALDQGRLLGTRLHAAAWTNLGRDHLDYHPDVAAYAEAKRRLFSELLPSDATGWVNGDDVEVRGALAVGDHVRAFSFGAAGDAAAQVAGFRADRDGLSLVLHVDGARLALRTPLLGRHNAQNLVVAALLARSLGVSDEDIVRAARTLRAPRGRLQPVDNAIGALVLVDYAHTPDALRAVLAVGRDLVAPGRRLSVVFGCGGDRDRGKRGPMGAAAATLADLCFATSDNPRSEDPEAILVPVVAGLRAAGAQPLKSLVPSALLALGDGVGYVVDADRETAIRRAIGALGPGDVLVVAGKGHETTQTLQDGVRDFDDVAVSSRWLAQRKPGVALHDARHGPLQAFAFTGETAAAVTGGERKRPGEPTTALTTDTRAITPGALFVALVGERFDGNDYLHAAVSAGATGVVCSRGKGVAVADAGPRAAWVCEVDDTLVALGDLARAHRRRFSGPVVCITGSNGKTSTKELTALALGAGGEVLATYRNHNNRIGVPQTLAKLRARHDFAVVECGMSLPGEIAELGRIAEPDVAVVTNVGAAHLEGLGTVEAVAREKADLLRALGPSGVAVVPADSALLAPHVAELRCRVVRFGPGGEVCCEGDVRVDEGCQRFVANVAGRRVPVTLPALGVHMVRNTLASLAVCHALGQNVYAAAAAIARFEPVGQRMRPLTLGPRLVLEDCYNANPASMDAALATLEGLPGPHVAVVGDMLELGLRAVELHSEVGALAARRGVQVLLARGAFAEATVRGARAAGLQAARIFTDDIDAAQAALEHTAAGGTVLVKGSRGARMERVIDAMTTLAAGDELNARQEEGDRVPLAL